MTGIQEILAGKCKFETLDGTPAHADIKSQVRRHLLIWNSPDIAGGEIQFGVPGQIELRIEKRVPTGVSPGPRTG